jgi:hypothetical protein
MYSDDLEEDSTSTSVTAYAIYDPTTGDVRHLHEVEFMPGATAIDRLQIERTALKLAALNHDVAGCRVFHVPPQIKIDPSKAYKVDLWTMGLVETDEQLGPRFVGIQRRYMEAAVGGIVGGLIVALLWRFVTRR